MRKKWQPSKWEIYDRITGEVIISDLSKYEAEDELADMFFCCWKDCCCEKMQELLDSAFPYEKRKMGKGWYRASKQMVEAWTELERINKEFCDAWNNAPTKEEAEEATERLRRYYNSIWYIEIELDGEMWKYIIDYDTQLPLFRQISDGCLCKVDPKFDEEEDVMYYTLLTELGNHEYLDRYIEKMRNNSE